MTAGPVGMASTPIGTVFLYEMAPGDLAEYERQPYADAGDRVRWLLSRVASKSSAGNGAERPAMLTRGETATLSGDDVEALAEVFVASPANQWHARKAQESGALALRGEDESAVDYFDRLVRWRGSLPPEVAAPRRDAFVPFAQESARAKPPEAATRQLLSWVSAGLAISVLLSSAALAFAAMSYFEAKADHQASESWRADTRRMQETKAPGAEKLVAELSAENARLRYRLELIDAKTRAAVKPGTPRSSPRSQPVRSGRQAAR
jgi:hypothetical protein